MTTPLTGFAFDADALARALSGELEGGPDAAVEPTDELRSVARGIAGHHVEVIAAYVGTALAGEPSAADHHQFAAALRSLLRLAEAAGDHRQQRLLADMRVRVEAEALRSSRRSTRFRRELRAWVESFATCLDPSDAERLLERVDHPPEAQPLLAELANLKGIGRRRLERLYASGLYTVEVAARATPEEVASVPGLPASLAAEVVRAARAFAVERRDACVVQIRARIEELRRMLAVVEEPLRPWMVRDLQGSSEALGTIAAALSPRGEDP